MRLFFVADSEYFQENFETGIRGESFFISFNNLNIIKGGTRVFINKKNDYLPTQELALSQLLRKGAFPNSELDLDDALSFLRRDNIMPENISGGWNLITYQNVSLGFVKNIGKRVNNYFPVEWRIRMDLPEKGKENIIRWQ